MRGVGCGILPNAMNEYIRSIQQALAALEEQRRHIDADIEDLRRIVSRHGAASLRPTEHGPKGRTPEPDSGRLFAPPGVARQEILDLMADGEVWTPGKVAAARGTSSNAASATMKRMRNEPNSPIEEVPPLRRGNYRLVSPKGDTQGSLPPEGGRESEEHPGGGDL